jgi:acyl-ACP thioesterase
MDPAGHINNSHYWAPLEEEIADTQRETIDVEIEYRDPAMPGDAVVIRQESSMWIASAGGAVHASLVRA